MFTLYYKYLIDKAWRDRFEDRTIHMYLSNY